MGSLPDWLALGVAILGLFGGAATGVYVGAVHRARLDDRRVLARSYLPWLRGIFFAGSSAPPDFDAQSNYDSLEQDASVHAIYTLRSLVAINEIVRMLPWQDRAVWHRSLLRLVRIDDDAFESLCRLYVDPRSTRFSADRPELLEKAKPVMQRLSKARFNNRELNSAYLEAVSDMERHLLRHINPRITSRVANAALAVRLIHEGPRPWSRCITPEHMTLRAQVQQAGVDCPDGI